MFYSFHCFRCILLFVYCSSFVLTLMLVQRYTRFTEGQIWHKTINWNLLVCYRWKQNWNITSGTNFMTFLGRPYFHETSARKMTISAFWATSWKFFSIFFLNIDKFCQILSTLPSFKSIGPSKQKLRRVEGRIWPPPPRHTNLQKARTVEG